jgi:hypothetical protein
MYIKQLIDEANDEIEHEIEDLTNEIEDEIEVISHNQIGKKKDNSFICVFFFFCKATATVEFLVCSVSLSLCLFLLGNSSRV